MRLLLQHRSSRMAPLQQCPTAFQALVSQFGEALVSSSLAEELWQFLHEPEIKQRLFFACEFHMPALRAVVEKLEARFGPALEPDRVRQFVGAMIREVLRPYGISPEAHGIKILRGKRFKSATRYTWPPMSGGSDGV